MNLKCTKCGLIRTKKQAYKKRYALVSEDNIIMLSNMNKLRLNCPKCGNTLHTVVEE